MKYIIVVTHKNGKRLEKKLYYTRSGSLYYEEKIRFVKLFDTEKEAMQAAHKLQKMHKEINRTTYNCTIEPIAEDDARLVPAEVRPLF